MGFLSDARPLEKEDRNSLIFIIIIIGILYASLYAFNSYANMTHNIGICQEYPYQTLDISEKHLLEEYNLCYAYLNNLDLWLVSQIVIIIFELLIVGWISYLIAVYIQYEEDKNNKGKR